MLKPEVGDVMATTARSPAAEERREMDVIWTSCSYDLATNRLHFSPNLRKYPGIVPNLRKYPGIAHW
jgi:hypothetical protein